MKKILSFLLVLVMMLTMMTAVHAESLNVYAPSKTTDDLQEVIDTKTESGVELRDDFEIVMEELTEEMRAEVDKIKETLDTDGGVFVDHFTAEEQEKIAAVMPEGADMRNLVAYEIIALSTKNYDSEYGAVKVLSDLTYEYSADKAVVAMIGFNTEAGMEWFALQTKVTETGVEITFPEEILVRMENEPAMLVIASEPIV